jgi:hypothetical protein
VSNRDRDFRPSRRRDFDDDNYQPPSCNFGYAPPRGPQFDSPTGPTVRATVKWYNASRWSKAYRLGWRPRRELSCRDHGEVTS